MEAPAIHNWKLYFKAKITREWEPYFVGQRQVVNTANKEDIINIVNKYIPNKIIAWAMIDDLHSYFMSVGYQLRLAGNPMFFRECVGEEKYEDFVRSCTKMSLSTIDIKNYKGGVNTVPLSMFSLYQYFDVITKE